MTRMLTLVTLATILGSTAMAGAAPDIQEPVPDDAPICDSADFKNQGQWIQCLQDNGLRGKELARRIHDEHQARKGGGEPTDRSKRHAKGQAAKAELRRGSGR